MDNIEHIQFIHWLIHQQYADYDEDKAFSKIYRNEMITILNKQHLNIDVATFNFEKLTNREIECIATTLIYCEIMKLQYSKTYVYI